MENEAQRPDLTHPFSEPKVTGHGFAWVCRACGGVHRGMPPDREARCDAVVDAYLAKLETEAAALRARVGELEATLAAERGA